MAFHRCQGLIARARGLIEVARQSGSDGPFTTLGLPVVVVVGLTSMAMPAPAVAQIAGQPGGQPVPLDEPTKPESIVRLIADLDSAKLEVRERAQDELGDRKRCSLAMLEDHLYDPKLTEEQRLRLHSAGFQLFCTTVRGAMGVNISGATPQGIVIGGTVEGFDSRLVLQPGDVIRTINGRPVADQPQFQAAIVSHDPDDEVPLSVLRKGEALSLTVRLGPYYKLGNQRRFGGLDDQSGRMPEERTLEQAWRVRLARIAKVVSAQLPGPIDAIEAQPDLQAFEPTVAPVASRVMRRDMRDMDEAGFSVTSLVAGGEPRGGTGWSSGMFMVRGGVGGLQIGGGDPVMLAQIELEIAQRRRDEVRVAIQENRAIIDDPQTPADLRKDKLLQNVFLEEQLKLHEIEVREANQRLSNTPQRDRRVP